MTKTQKLDQQIHVYSYHLTIKKNKAVSTVVKTFPQDNETQYCKKLNLEIIQSL
jgi:hypothetical protein